MGLFSKKPVSCTLCKKETIHKHRPKKEWNMEYPLCTDCYMKSLEQYYNGSFKQKCKSCGSEQKLTDLWEPRWQWDMDGLLCKACFDAKEVDFNQKKETCSVCGTKLGFFRYNPKSIWNVNGQLCRECWDKKKEQHK
jgi:hypothetical protein